jgi:hypothetical protein
MSYIRQDRMPLLRTETGCTYDMVHVAHTAGEENTPPDTVGRDIGRSSLYHFDIMNGERLPIDYRKVINKAIGSVFRTPLLQVETKRNNIEVTFLEYKRTRKMMRYQTDDACVNEQRNDQDI